MSLTSFLNTQYRVEAGVTTLAYVAAALSLLGDVTGREIFGHGIWGAPRFAAYAAIISGFLGVSLAANDGVQIRPQVFDALMPPAFDKYVNRAADALSGMLYAALGVLAVRFVMASFENWDIAPVLDWPLWPIQLVLPYTFFSLAFRYFSYVALPTLKSEGQRGIG